MRSKPFWMWLLVPYGSSGIPETAVFLGCHVYREWCEEKKHPDKGIGGAQKPTVNERGQRTMGRIVKMNTKDNALGSTVCLKLHGIPPEEGQRSSCAGILLIQNEINMLL